jgi:hypothetical protein
MFFDTLSDAIREAKRSRHKVFVSIHDEFEAPQFYPGSGGADDVNAQGYLILDKRRAGIYDSRVIITGGRKCTFLPLRIGLSCQDRPEACRTRQMLAFY